jgi:hypothetical protein
MGDGGEVTAMERHQEASAFRDRWDRKDGFGVGAAEGGTWGHDIHAIGFR